MSNFKWLHHQNCGSTNLCFTPHRQFGFGKEILQLCYIVSRRIGLTIYYLLSKEQSVLPHSFPPHQVPQLPPRHCTSLESCIHRDDGAKVKSVVHCDRGVHESVRSGAFFHCVGSLLEDYSLSSFPQIQLTNQKSATRRLPPHTHKHRRHLPPSA